MPTVIDVHAAVPPASSPWNLVAEDAAFTDLVLLCGGAELRYHTAVVAQHSALLRDILQPTSCCRARPETVITLDCVDQEVLKDVMAIVYDGCGKVTEDAEEFRKIVDMLYLDTFFIREKEDQNGNKKDGKDNEHSEKVYNGADFYLVNGNLTADKDEDFISGIEAHLLTSDLTEINELENCNILMKKVDDYEDEEVEASVYELLDLPQEHFDLSANSAIDKINHQLKAEDSNFEDHIANGEGYKVTEPKEHKSKAELDRKFDNTIENDDEDEIIEISPDRPSASSKARAIEHMNSSQSSKQEEKILIEEGEEENELCSLLDDTLSEVTCGLMKRKRSADVGPPTKYPSILTEVLDAFESEQNLKEPPTITETDDEEVFHCPFENCSYSNRKALDLQTHIGARHYRTKIMVRRDLQLFPV